MAIGKEIKVVLTLDDKGFKVGVRDANGTLKQLHQTLDETAKSVKKVEGHFSSFGHKAHQVVMTMGMARFALMDLRDIFLSFPLAILKTSGEVERLSKLMEGLSSETDQATKKLEAASNVKFLFNVAQNAPFEVKALGDAMVKFKTGGIDPLNGSLQALVDGVAKFGGSSEQMKRASIAIQQMAGKGVVSMEELRQQLGEAVPTAMAAMAEGMGVSMAELTKRVSTGTLGATTAINKMLAVMHVQNAGAAAAMMDTWVGMIERLKTQWELFKLEVGEEGLFNNSKKALKELLSMLGGDGSTSFARALGRGIDDAAKAAINLTKKIVEMWEAIKLAGEAILFYWGAGKIAGGLKAAFTMIERQRAALLLNRDFAEALLEDEKRNKVAAINESNRQDQRKIDSLLAANNAERAMHDRSREMERQALREKIRTNQVKIAAEEAVVSQHVALQAALHESPYYKTRNIAGMQSAFDRDKLRVHEQFVEGYGRLSAAARQNITVMQAENNELTRRSAFLGKSTAAVSAEMLARQSSIATLQNGIGVRNADAAAILRQNTALSAARAALGSVGTFLKSTLWSMNGLMLAVMGGIYIWDAWSDAAKRAAREAQTAIEFQDRLKRGRVTNEDNSDLVNQITREQKELVVAEAKLRQLAAQRKLLLKGNRDTTKIDADLEAAKQNIEDLTKRIGDNQKGLSQGLLQAADSTATRNASEAAQKVFDEAAKEVQHVADSKKALEGKYAELAKKNTDGRRTKAQDAQFEKDKRELDLQGLEGEKAFLEAHARQFRENAAAATATGAQAAEYQKVAKLIDAQITNVNGMINSLLRPDDNITKDKKPEKAKKPTDDLAARMKADRRAITEMQGDMQNFNSDVIGLKQLKEQAQAEIDNLVAQNVDKGIVNKPEQIQKAVEQLTQRKTLDLALNEMAAVMPKLEQSKEKLRQLEEQIATGNYREAPNDENSKVLQRLQAIQRLSPEASAAMEGVVAKQKELLEVSARSDIAEGLIDAAKRIREAEVAGIVDARERKVAEHQKEVDDVAHKYDRLLELALQYDKDTAGIFEKRAKEIELINKKLALSLETPIQALAREWRDGTGQLESATRSWSESFLDTITTALTGGGLKWREFTVGVMKSILDMQIKKTFGAQITGMFDGLGTKIGGWLGIARAAPAAVAPSIVTAAGDQAAAAAVTPAVTTMAGQTAAKMFSDNLKQTAQAANAANTAITSMTTDGVTGATTSLVQQALTTGISTTVEQQAAVSIGALAFAAEAASVALAKIAMQQAADEVAGLFGFANGGIMSSLGSVPLKKYANGGIANRPQVAIYGEGAMNEAYVPLPDGRSIPVTMTGGQQGSGGVQVGISIVVNEADGTSETETTGQDDRQAWTAMANRVKGVVQEELVKQSRPGGILYK